MFGSIDIKTKEKIEMIEIFDQIKSFVEKSGVLHGIITIYVPHATAGVSIYKNYDEVMQEDMINALEQLVPLEGNYKHIEGNAAAHIKASLVGNSINLIINDGRIEVGMFQSVFLCDFDGPRKRRVLMKIIEG